MATKQNYVPQQVDTSEHLKNILEVAGTASLLSAQNMLVISDPGTGKTSLMYHMGRQVFGDGSMKIECTPSLREERLVGYQNPAYLLDPEAEAKGLPYWVVDNTPRDPNIEHVVLAELSRIGDLANDALIHVLDDVNSYHKVVAWADSNWLTPTQRNAALRDRFGMTVHYTLPIVDMERVMVKPEISSWVFDIPDAEAIYRVRGWMEEWLAGGCEGTHALNTILAALYPIQEVIQGKSFVLNHRRIRQWQKVMYCMGAYWADKPDFKELPNEAYQALAYCYPTETPEQALEWYGIVMAGVDAVLTAIAEHEAQAYAQWQATFEEIKRERNPQQRQQRIVNELGALLGKSQQELRRRFPNDVRAMECEGRLYTMFQRALTTGEI